MPQITSTSKLRREWPHLKSGSGFAIRNLARYYFASSNDKANVQVNKITLEAWAALDATLVKFGYRLIKAETGAWVDRPITGGSGTSLHAHGIAADMNYPKGAYVRREVRYTGPQYGEAAAQQLEQHGWPAGTPTDRDPKMMAAVLRIKTRSGVYVFRSGGLYSSISDEMHLEIICGQADITSGIDWTTVDGTQPTAEQYLPKPTIEIPLDKDNLPTLKLGSSGPAVLALQRELVAEGFDVPFDGTFGPEDDAAVRQFQASEGLVVDGIWGKASWARVLDNGWAKDEPVDNRTLIDVEGKWIAGALLDTDRGAWLLMEEPDGQPSVWGSPYYGAPNTDPNYDRERDGWGVALEAPGPAEHPATAYCIVVSSGKRFCYGG